MASPADPMRILIVEDSPTQAEQLSHILEGSGYDVAVAGDGVAALARLAEHQPDLVISDIVMPQMDGYELCRRIRADKRTSELPVVLLTALSDTQDVLEGLSCDADGFITKPFSQDYLLEQIARMLSERQRPEGSGQKVSVDVMWGGKKCVIVTDRRRTVTLLISTYEAAVRRSAELSRTQAELRSLNDRLEEMVAERTAALSQEIAERNRLAAAIEQAGETIVITDPGGAIQYVNPAFERTTGYSREEALGRNPRLLKSGLQDAAFYRGLWRAIASGRVWQGRFANRRKDGSLYTEEATISPVLDAAGRIVNYVAVKRDITEQLRAAEEQARLEDQLRQAQKIEAIGRLAGGVAHDFNNLTAIVLGYGEILLSELRPEDPLHKYAEQVVAAGRRSAALTAQLLAFSRKQTLQPEVLDPNALLRNLEQMLRRLIGENVELVFRLAEGVCCVKADPGQLEQIVTNLVLNARDAMPLGGRLTVETADVELDQLYAMGHESVAPGRYVMLAITDNGCGMDKATMARLFEPFFTTKPMGKGTGLGLATAYGIVKQSGGNIWAYSEPGQGTTFKIYLPRTEARPEAKAAEIVGEAPRGRGELILLVEDEEALRELCQTVLARLGYRVRTAEDGLAALRLVEEQGLEPDLVVTDVIMPGISGAELAQRLWSARPGLKVLFMSGYPDETVAPHGVLGAGTPFIQKPFTERALAVRVRWLLGGEAAAPPSGRRILMIDDDQQYRDLVAHYCRKRGHTCVGVDSSAAAIEALAGASFDVLLVDLTIPGTSGAIVLREIRDAGHAVPAMVLTGNVAAADLDSLRPLGVERVLDKSSRPEALLQAIEEGAARGDGVPPLTASAPGALP